jgi:hypothetical protein
MSMWTSKLGSKYSHAWITEQDANTHRDLRRLRGQDGNNTCADCGVKDTTWASVNHGVFICVGCSDVRRSVGTHVTKVKGCTGTYLWGPDELEQMQTVGNRNAEKIYGARKVPPEASKQQKQEFVLEKYERKLFADMGAARMSAPVTPATGMSLSRPEPAAEVVKAAPAPPARNAAVGLQGRRAVPVPRSAPVARVVEVPDCLFDELFADWAQPVPAKVPTAPKAEINAVTPSTGLIEDIFRTDAPGKAPKNTLEDVDDIFAIFK